jgi:metal-responsive CopG/Arc/MetJ family transcriptional regulator
MLQAIDLAVAREDSDRSKFIRNALRNRIGTLDLIAKEKPQ